MEMKEAKRKVRVVEAHLLSEPNHFAHIQRQVRQIIDGVRGHESIFDGLSGVSHRVVPETRKAGRHLFIKGCAILSRRINLRVCDVAGRGFMVSGDEPVQHSQQSLVAGRVPIPNGREELLGRSDSWRRTYTHLVA